MPHTSLLNRRHALGLGASAMAAATLASSDIQAAEAAVPPLRIVDTNVSLFRWPFRRLPLDEINTLIEKLRALGISQAWAGSFEGLLHRDIAQVNQHLVEACRDREELLPVGSINPTLPDWEHDLRHCLEAHRMSAIRLHPGYHGYALDDARLPRLLALTAAAKCVVQIAVAMEDVRTQHPLLRVEDVNLDPLPELMLQVKDAPVQLLNCKPSAAALRKLGLIPGLYFDTSRVEGTDGVPQLLQSLPSGRVMFGSHAPFLVPEAALIRVHESGQLQDAALRDVFAGNADRLLAQAHS